MFVNTKILVNVSIIPSLTGNEAKIESVNDRGRFIKNHSLYKEKRWILFNDIPILLLIEALIYTVHVAESAFHTTSGNVAPVPVVILRAASPQQV